MTSVNRCRSVSIWMRGLGPICVSGTKCSGALRFHKVIVHWVKGDEPSVISNHALVFWVLVPAAASLLKRPAVVALLSPSSLTVSRAYPHI